MKMHITLIPLKNKGLECDSFHISNSKYEQWEYPLFSFTQFDQQSTGPSKYKLFGTNEF